MGYQRHVDEHSKDFPKFKTGGEYEQVAQELVTIGSMSKYYNKICLLEKNPHLFYKDEDYLSMQNFYFEFLSNQIVGESNFILEIFPFSIEKNNTGGAPL